MKDKKKKTFPFVWKNRNKVAKGLIRTSKFTSNMCDESVEKPEN